MYPIPLPTYRSNDKSVPAGFIPTAEMPTYLSKLEELQDKGAAASRFVAESHDITLGAAAKKTSAIGRVAYRCVGFLKVTEKGTYTIGVNLKTPTQDNFYAALVPSGRLAGPMTMFVQPSEVLFPHVIDIRVEGQSILHEKGSVALGSQNGQPITYNGTYDVVELRSMFNGVPADKLEVEVFVAANLYVWDNGLNVFSKTSADKIFNEQMGFTVNLKTPRQSVLGPAPMELIFHEVRGEAAAAVAAPAAAAQAPIAGASTGTAPATLTAPAAAPSAPVAAPPAPAVVQPVPGQTSAAPLPAAVPVAAAGGGAVVAAGGGAAVAAAAPKPVHQPDTLVKAVQERLNALGYDAGAADGSMGPKTTASIKRFEEATGTPANGKIDQALLDKLYKAEKGVIRLDYGNALGAAGLPNTILSALSKDQINKLRLIIGDALNSYPLPPNGADPGMGNGMAAPAGQGRHGGNATAGNPFAAAFGNGATGNGGNFQFQPAAPFKFNMGEGTIHMALEITGAPADNCRTYTLTVTLPTGIVGKSSKPQNACRAGTAWKLS